MTRLELHEALCTVLGSRNVYYQPPENVKINYPAIVYSRENIRNDFADDTVYAQSHFFQITVIDDDPDSQIVVDISKFPSIRFNRHFVSDNLNHDVFILYY